MTNQLFMRLQPNFRLRLQTDFRLRFAEKSQLLFAADAQLFAATYWFLWCWRTAQCCREQTFLYCSQGNNSLVPTYSYCWPTLGCGEEAFFADISGRLSILITDRLWSQVDFFAVTNRLRIAISGRPSAVTIRLWVAITDRFSVVTITDFELQS